MRTLLLNEIYGNLVKSGLIQAILFIITAGINLFAFQKIANKKQLKQFRARTLYIACFILLFFMARIWVEGFTHLLAILGIVSAALVITNKESIISQSLNQLSKSKQSKYTQDPHPPLWDGLAGQRIINILVEHLKLLQ